MIEYTDKNLGKIKVLNVTEARANFASVLGDAHSHYIITKNNKPLRVIVNYDEYERLKNAALSAGVVPVSPSSLQTTPTPTPVTKKKEIKHRPAQSRVPGLLESNIALSKESSERPKTIKKPVYRSRIPVPGVTAETVVPPVAQAPKTIAPDPRLAEESPKVASEETLSALSKLLQGEASAEQGDVTEDQEDSYFTAAEDDLLEQPSDDDLYDTELDEPETIDSDAGVDTEDAVDDVSPEEQEYFKKYQKLYQSMGISIEGPDEDSDLDEQLAAKYDKLLSSGSEDEPVSKVADEIELESNVETQSYESSEVEQAIGSDFLTELEPEEVEENYFEEPEPQEDDIEVVADAGGQALPSLKDLLKDLEGEHLIGEEDDESKEELNENEIDALINRITQD